MKTKTIVGIVVLIGFSSLLLMNFGTQVGGYMNFDQAFESGAKAHVVGGWVEEEAFTYDRSQNIFKFHMTDEIGNIREVQYSNPKPPNFEDADQLVVEGHSSGEIFVAESILVKCPSKYEQTLDDQAVPDLTTS